ncbi:MAG: hypothetical protein Q4C98_11640 [Capnocytophaga sp.]|nr:hypothetical protein [Capnocytophaga sp.]
MQKAQNVNKIVFSILLLVVQTSVFSQKKIEGRYHQASDFYKFNPDDTFEYRQVEELGIGYYGKGYYKLVKDSLILNYNLTEIRLQGYHISKPYVNFKDIVYLKLKVFDFDKKLLENVQVLVFQKSSFLDQKTTNKEGEVTFNVQKNQEQSIIQVIYEECTYMFDIKFNSSYEIDVYLSKTSDYLVGTAIKDAMQSYKILKIKDDYFEVQTLKGGKLRFERTKEGFYGDDPFKQNKGGSLLNCLNLNFLKCKRHKM